MSTKLPTSPESILILKKISENPEESLRIPENPKDSQFQVKDSQRFFEILCPNLKENLGESQRISKNPEECQRIPKNLRPEFKIFSSKLMILQDSLRFSVRISKKILENPEESENTGGRVFVLRATHPPAAMLPPVCEL